MDPEPNVIPDQALIEKIQAEAQTQEILGQQPKPTKPVSPDDDPNLKLQRIVSRRKEPKQEDQKPEEKKKVSDPDSSKNLSGLIGKALGFREENANEKEITDKKTEDKQPKEKAETQESKTAKPKEAAAEEKKDEEAKKTIVTRKKSAAPVADPVQIAAAAATAAVKAAIPEQRQHQQATQPKPEDSLKEDDLHEYEVAKHLAETNPRYKDAPKIVLEHIKKAEAYAASWEQSNKGKVFDPGDEEHDEFFSALEKPWSDHEFRRAEIRMEAKKLNDEERSSRSSGIQDEVNELKVENARIALAPVVERTYTAAAGLLAKKIGDDVHEKIVKGSFDKFAEEDPITAEELASTIGPLQPVIEAAIQLDDPKGRFEFNPKNPAHIEWNRVFLEKESQLVGADDGSGKTMVSRKDFVSMTPLQRSKHWYLTTEHLIEEIVNDAAETVKENVQKQKKRYEKIASSIGYVPKNSDTTEKKASDASMNSGDGKIQERQSEPVKPLSPSSGGSSKIDDKGSGVPSATKKLMDSTANILFSR